MGIAKLKQLAFENTAINCEAAARSLVKITKPFFAMNTGIRILYKFEIKLDFGVIPFQINKKL